MNDNIHTHVIKQMKK